MASALMHEGPERAATSHVLPQPQQLAALGTVLCLYRLQHGSELSGWAQAAYAEATVGVDSDGLRESVRFFDSAGRCCWRLHLLPDSDFLAWDRMMTSLPRMQEATENGNVAERLWRRMAGRLLSRHWRACTVRLYALTQGASPVLAASLASVSPLGAATVRRIVDAEGVEADIVSESVGHEVLLTASATQYGFDSERTKFEFARIKSPTLALPRDAREGEMKVLKLSAASIRTCSRSCCARHAPRVRCSQCSRIPHTLRLLRSATGRLPSLATDREQVLRTAKTLSL